MKIHIVGDIHGDLELLKNIFSLDGKFIFVGDFLDSFKHSIDSQISCIDLVLSEIENGRANSCLGNHEASYLFSGQECSGWNNITDIKLQPFKFRILNLFKLSHTVGDWKVTHAGLHPSMIDMELNDIIPSERLFQCGRESGGRYLFGGPLWLRPQEFSNHTTKQIFGHTPNPEIVKVGEAWLIDCLQFRSDILTYENGELVITHIS